MSSIIPLPAVAGSTVPDMRPLAFVLASTEPDLWAPVLPGELPEDTAARLAVAGDWLDELLYEFPAAEAVAA
jgi:hypothetical protein